MPAPVLMVQGTASSVGKSLIAAALCRSFARKGLRVAPFKAQNMSNNAQALPGGFEIGRAQALQAAAARTEPRPEMNPILLKPEGDAVSQVLVMGKPYKRLAAREYRVEKDYLWTAVTRALDSLRASCDLVIVEGAGSPAEINLKADEIVNMAVAKYANAPVLLVGDIDPGGVFAQFVGTLSLLDDDERALVRGLIVNKFRGDMSLLSPGLRSLESLTDLPVLGVIPMLQGLTLAEEDGAALEPGCARDSGGSPSCGRDMLDIAVIRLPRISNFDDIDPLRLESGLRIRFVSSAAELGLPNAVILPGSKATIADLAWLRSTGLADGLRYLAFAGHAILGICGGFQMLGESLQDPCGIEGRAQRDIAGLGLLPVKTIFASEKKVVRVRGRVCAARDMADLRDMPFAAAAGSPVEGYEIHAGRTELPASAPALFEIEDEDGTLRPDGTWAHGGKLVGSYLHGLFDAPDFRRAWLASLGWQAGASSVPQHLAQARENSLENLADAVETSLNMEKICKLIGIDSFLWRSQ